MFDGLVVVDKPAGFTSHDVVAKLRKAYGQRKVGHAGTLDPDATGVLLVGLGRATRLLRYLSEAGKAYEGRVVFGIATSTLDAAGEVLDQRPMPITRDDVEGALPRFLGDIEQLPPMVSAVKVGGRRLHELARAGQEVERAPRPVHVDRFDVVGFEAGPYPEADIEVECGSGTYIRTLAADLGHALGGGAHLTDLRRTRIGSFGEDDAHPVEELVVLPAREGLRDYAQTTVDDEVAFLVSNGRVLDPDQLGGAGGPVSGPGPWAVSDGTGRLLAVYERVSTHRVKPALVLPPG
jgi:tRNA pseudouridine55 synthase